MKTRIGAKIRASGRVQVSPKSGRHVLLIDTVMRLRSTLVDRQRNGAYSRPLWVYMTLLVSSTYIFSFFEWFVRSVHRARNTSMVEVSIYFFILLE